VRISTPARNRLLVPLPLRQINVFEASDKFVISFHLISFLHGWKMDSDVAEEFRSSAIPAIGVGDLAASRDGARRLSERGVAPVCRRSSAPSTTGKNHRADRVSHTKTSW
jgi:hypothetical protein